MQISDLKDNKGYVIGIEAKYIVVTTVGEKENHTFKLSDDVLKFILSQVEKEADRRDLSVGDYIKAIPTSMNESINKNIKKNVKKIKKYGKALRNKILNDLKKTKVAAVERS